jgi:hypothetical protein
MPPVGFEPTIPVFEHLSKIAEVDSVSPHPTKLNKKGEKKNNIFPGLWRQ